MDLIDTLLFLMGVENVMVTKILFRIPPVNHCRHWMDTDWFNKRVCETNLILQDQISKLPHDRATLWYMKGFWSPAAKQAAFSTDGVHFSPAAQHKLFLHLQAAVSPS